MNLIQACLENGAIIYLSPVSVAFIFNIIEVLRNYYFTFGMFFSPFFSSPEPKAPGELIV